MTTPYKISANGLDLIKHFEGLELEAYQDIVGVWTIGYGHTSKAGWPEVKNGLRITKAEADQILQKDLRAYERAVVEAIKATINQPMFDALVSITYNIGTRAMRTSTFRERLNRRDYDGAAESMEWWNKAGGKAWPGLVRRRAAEKALFLRGLDEMYRRPSSCQDGFIEECPASVELDNIAKVAVASVPENAIQPQRLWWDPRRWVTGKTRRNKDAVV